VAAHRVAVHADRSGRRVPPQPFAELGQVRGLFHAAEFAVFRSFHSHRAQPPDILAAVGLTLGTGTTKADRKRDPAFRQRVLTAYEYRCAVCGFDVRLGSVSIALDAAHIRWHQAGGPDVENNGLALWVLHHKTFDLGAFTLDREGVLLVSDQANGTAGFEEALLRHHGKRVRQAQRPEWAPEPGFLDWHGRQVFKGAARHLAHGPESAP
jgi:putative restriction endonuclease